MYKKFIAYTLTLFLVCTSQIAFANHTQMTKVIEKIMPAVVEVISEQHENPVVVKKGFEMRKKGNQQQNNPFSSGSGFVISADGYVITNAHVVKNVFDGGIIHIIFKNGERYEVDLINYEEDSDILNQKYVKQKSTSLPI